jgi:hypothetical protein
MSVHLQKPFWKRLKAMLGLAGRWTLVSVVLGFALIGFATCAGDHRCGVSSTIVG